jgi:hypothetical protein
MVERRAGPISASRRPSRVARSGAEVPFGRVAASLLMLRLYYAATRAWA